MEEARRVNFTLRIVARIARIISCFCAREGAEMKEDAEKRLTQQKKLLSSRELLHVRAQGFYLC